MIGGFSFWHLLLLGVVLIVVFGGGRFSTMMGDVAKGIKQFKKGMAEEDEEKAATRLEGKPAPDPEPAVKREAEPVREER